MTKKKVVKIGAITLAVYVLLALGFYWLGGDQLRSRGGETDTVSPMSAVGEIVAGTELRQDFIAPADELLHVQLFLSTFGRENTSHLEVSVLDESGAVLAVTTVDTSTLEDNKMQIVPFVPGIPTVPGTRLTLRITAPDAEPGNAVTLWYGNTVSTGRAQIAVEIAEDMRLVVDGVPINGELVHSFYHMTKLHFLSYYWYIAASLAAVLIAVFFRMGWKVSHGESTPLARMFAAFGKYGYLMRQLISRDFKTKYKRSVLGVFWSFLNPLLTMLVQYLVFSTLFKSDIPNFPLYLLTGIVCFGFFSEATGMSLMSIVGNASLITKVYMPKYIYPVSRVLSSTVNFLLSLIPLFLVMLFTKTPLRPAALLLPFPILCLLLFCIGMGFLLSASMVFFRDTQFLWGVFSTLWMYATPIFYPESIIPASLLPVFKCNPLYHFIRFLRILLIDGVSPEPKAYGLCLVAALIPLLLGALVFKKKQDAFVLNL